MLHANSFSFRVIDDGMSDISWAWMSRKWRARVFPLSSHPGAFGRVWCWEQPLKGQYWGCSDCSKRSNVAVVFGDGHAALSLVGVVFAAWCRTRLGWSRELVGQWRASTWRSRIYVLGFVVGQAHTLDAASVGRWWGILRIAWIASCGWNH